jgi:plastocyanin
VLRIGLVIAAIGVAIALPVQGLAAPRHSRSTPEVVVRQLHAASPSNSFGGSVNLIATPGSAVVGEPVSVRVGGGPSQSADHRWHVSGPAIYRADTGSSPQVQITFQSPGTHAVALKLIGVGSSRSLSLDLVVKPRPHAAVPATPAPKARPARPPVAQAPLAHPAGDPGVTIVDFQFNPGTITIHAGDTITWTNTGAQPHTATANDHSFDTGVLKRGQSASHTFSTPGTFSYICTIHPFMKGTVTVVASGSSGGGSGSGGGSSSGGSSSSGSGSSGSSGSGSSGSASTTSSGSLPFTGFNLLAAGLCGLTLIASGLALRWWARSGRTSASPRSDLAGHER